MRGNPVPHRMKPVDRVGLLPGEELIREGLEHLRRGEVSIVSLLVSIGASRLRNGGLDIPAPIPDADLRLYQLLSETYGDDAHSRYNALVGQLVSFEQALECGR